MVKSDRDHHRIGEANGTRDPPGASPLGAPQVHHREHTHPSWVGSHVPLLDQTHEEALKEWEAERELWVRGEHPDQLMHQGDPQDPTAGLGYGDWTGGPPQPDLHRPDFGSDATWYQVYENVTEGTPVSPPFATLEELTEYLTQHGDWAAQRNGEPPPSREAVEQFIQDGYAASLQLTIGPEGEANIETGIRTLEEPAG